MTKKDKAQDKRGDEVERGEVPESDPPAESDAPLDEREKVIRAEEGLKEDLLSLTADIENLRKDMLAQNVDSARRATEFTVRAMAPALDALEMALRTMRGESQSDELANWRDGIEKVRDRFEQSFLELGVVPVSVDGVYDPKFHEAVEKVSGEQYQIVEVVGLGWMWRDGDTVIIPAKVHVGSGDDE